jgi:hypothetical protein
MGASISNTFGFNMGAKMGDFGFFEANGTTPPVDVQPKYIVLKVRLYNNNFELGFIQSQINTTTAIINSAQIDGTAPNLSYRIGFDNNFATTSDNVYVESYFNYEWNDSATNTIPLFQIFIGGLNEIIITPVDYDQTKNGATGYLNIALTIFEI